MQFSNRFAIAIHMFAYIHTYEGEEKMTSANLARSVNVNPVVIRQILSKLKAAGLLNSSQGSSHIEIAKNPEDITLLDIFRALDMMREDRLFGYHSNPLTECPVGRNIHAVLDDQLLDVQRAMENSLQSVTLADVFKDTASYVWR